MSLIAALKERTVEQFSLDNMLAHFSVEVPFHGTKKNGKRAFNGFVVRSARSIQAEEHLVRNFRSQANEKRIAEPFTEKLWCIFHFYFKREDFFTKASKFTQMSKFVPDLSNLYLLPEDALQKAGIIKDDRQIESHDLSRRLVGDKNRLDVFILRY